MIGAHTTISSRTATPLVTALAGLCLATAGEAREYQFDYGVDSRTSYRDNVNFRPDDGIDITGVRVALPATFSARDERSDLTVDGEVSTSKYDESSYDSDDQLLGGVYTYNTERNTYAVNSRLVRASTRDTAFLDDGQVGLSATRVERFTAGGSAKRQLSATDSLSATLDYRYTEYDNPRFVDGEFVTGSIGYGHSWSQRLSLLGVVSSDYYRNDAVIEVETVGYGLQGGFNFEASEQLQVSLLAGWLFSTTEYSTNTNLPEPDDGDGDENGYLIDSSIDYTRERDRLSGSLVSSTRESSQGLLQQSTRLEVEYVYQLSEYTRLSLGALGGLDGALDSRINNDRDYAKGSISIDHRVSREWRVYARYQYRWQDRERQSGEADDNAFQIGFSWDPEALIWSR